METFVFTLNLEQIRRSALVLRLQAHTPRKRTLGECVLSLRTLGPQETKHCLDFKPHSKTHVSLYLLLLMSCGFFLVLSVRFFGKNLKLPPAITYNDHIKQLLVMPRPLL